MAADISTQTKSITPLPIKHFSPTCCTLVEEFLAGGKYDTIFIELPVQAQKYVTAFKLVVPPVSFLIESGSYFYLPLTNYSPELIAIKLAQDKNIIFIDDAALMYSEKSDNNNCDDGFESGSALLEIAIDMQYDLPTELILSNLIKLGELCRKDISERERHMATVISNTQYSNALLIAGAAHIDNIFSCLDNPLCSVLSTGGIECWLIPYVPTTYKLYNYGFYKDILNEIKQGGNAYERRAVNFLMQTAREVVSDYEYENVPVTDIINCVTHTKLLSNFRGKRHIGAEELKESTLSVIAKGDETSIYYIKLISKLTTVDTGFVPSECDTPLMKDYRRQLISLKINPKNEGRITLAILANSAHRAKSTFLKQLEFLKINFATLISGADYITGRDKNLKREVWQFGNAKKAESELVKLSHLGSTVSEIVQNIIESDVDNSAISMSSTFADCYLRTFFLGIDGSKVFDILCESVYHVSDFCVAVEALERLNYFIGVRFIFDSTRDDKILWLSQSYYFAAVRLFCTSVNVEGESIVSSLASLYSIVESADYLDIIPLKDALLSVQPTDPMLRGGTAALLVKIFGNDSMRYIQSYIESESDAVNFGYYLMGCSITNRGIMTDEKFISAAAARVEQLPLADFLECAPCLRYGFSHLKIIEKRKVIEIIEGIYGEGYEDITVSHDAIFRDEYLARQLAIYKIKL